MRIVFKVQQKSGKKLYKATPIAIMRINRARDVSVAQRIADSGAGSDQMQNMLIGRALAEFFHKQSRKACVGMVVNNLI